MAPAAKALAAGLAASWRRRGCAAAAAAEGPGSRNEGGPGSRNEGSRCCLALGAPPPPPPPKAGLRPGRFGAAAEEEEVEGNADAAKAAAAGRFTARVGPSRKLAASSCRAAASTSARTDGCAAPGPFATIGGPEGLRSNEARPPAAAPREAGAEAASAEVAPEAGPGRAGS